MPKPIPLIFDDDGSQDGMTALAYMLANPKFDVQAITIVNGIARTEVFDDNIKRMLGRLGDTDIPIGVGRSTPLSGDNEFPDFIRDGSDTFWSPFVTIPEEVPDIETKPAVDLIIETIKNSPEPVAILATGPLTNIAEALRKDPSIIDNISIVQIMGGAVYVPGNLPVLPDPPFSTNETAEFNIWIDPVAAQEVFDAGQKGLKIQLTPLDATNQIEFDRQDYQEWLETGTPESAIAAELLDFALTVIQSDNDPNPVWDLVAAINLSEPNFSEETPLHIDVDTESEPGENQGQTKAVPGSDPNVLVSLNPSFDNIKFDAAEVFSYLGLPIVSLSDDNLPGTNAAEIINGGRGDDNIFGNGGMDTLIGGRGDDNIYGSSDSEIINGGRGDDIIYANGGDDLINSGAGFDIVYLGAGEATLVLEIGLGFDKIFNFQLGATKFEVSSLDNLTFADSANGAKIFQDNDLIAVVTGQSANTFDTNQNTIFVV